MTGWKDGHLFKQNKTMKRKIQQATKFGSLETLNKFLSDQGSSIISVSPVMWPDSQFAPPSIYYIVLYWKSIDL